MTDLSLNLKSQAKQYNIYIDDFSIEDLNAKILEQVSGKKVLLVISKKVNKLYGDKILPQYNNIYKYVLPDGEKHKNFKNYQRILNFALKNGFTAKIVFLQSAAVLSEI